MRSYTERIGAAVVVFVRPRGHGEPPQGFGLRMAAEEEQARCAAHRARVDEEDPDGKV